MNRAKVRKSETDRFIDHVQHWCDLPMILGLARAEIDEQSAEKNHNVNRNFQSKRRFMSGVCPYSHTTTDTSVKMMKTGLLLSRYGSAALEHIAFPILDSHRHLRLTADDDQSC